MTNSQKHDAIAGGIVFVVSILLICYFLYNFIGFSPDFQTKLDKSSISLQGDSQRDFYHQLTDKQKQIYDAVLPAVMLGEYSVNVPGVNMDDIVSDISRVTNAIENDHPELFWFFYIKSATPNLRGVGLTMSYYDYKTPLFDEEARYAELMAAVESLAQQARDHSDNCYEQALFVHDQLIKTAIYDHDALEKNQKLIHDPDTDYIYSAYGCLVQGKTVCSGYAKAYQLVLRELGMDCLYAQGYASGGRHAWNLVYMDDEHYYVDVTWNDYDFEPEMPMYNYAFVTLEDMNKSHTLDMKFDIPVCDDTTYQFYRFKGYFLEKYSFEKVSEIVSAQVSEQTIYIQFSNNREFTMAEYELIHQKRIYDIEGFAQEPFKLIRNYEYNTLTIYY